MNDSSWSAVMMVSIRVDQLSGANAAATNTKGTTTSAYLAFCLLRANAMATTAPRPKKPPRENVPITDTAIRPLDPISVNLIQLAENCPYKYRTTGNKAIMASAKWLLSAMMDVPGP